MATAQDLSVTKQHRNDRWDRCTTSAGDWQISTTTSHRSANQRYFMHNSATVHHMRMQSSALDSSRSQLCNDTSTGVVRHQMTKRRRLQKVVSYDVLHHSTRMFWKKTLHMFLDLKKGRIFSKNNAKSVLMFSVKARSFLNSGWINLQLTTDVLSY